MPGTRMNLTMFVFFVFFRETNTCMNIGTLIRNLSVSQLVISGDSAF